MSKHVENVTVFCASSSGLEPAYLEAAEAFGAALVERGMGLVYGGGSRGMMGAVARAVLAAGGRAVGIIPEFLTQKETPLEGLDALHTVRSMHERKTMMAELGDAFVALPGGVGTYEELFEALTWSQIGIHRKPIAVYRMGDYFDPLIDLLDRSVDAGFVQPHDRPRLLEGRTAAEVLDVLCTAEVPASTILPPEQPLPQQLQGRRKADLT